MVYSNIRLLAACNNVIQYKVIALWFNLLFDGWQCWIFIDLLCGFVKIVTGKIRKLRAASIFYLLSLDYNTMIKLFDRDESEIRDGVYF